MQRRVMTPHGEILFSLEYKKVKNINLRIVRGGEVKVSAPRAVGVEFIDSFVISRADFILRAIDKLGRVEPPSTFSDGEQVFILGTPYTLRSTPSAVNRAVVIDGAIVVLCLKKDAGTAVRRTLVEKLRQTALLRTVPSIVDRAMPYFGARGIARPTLSYRAMRSRWGSCHTKKGHITLAKALAKCPVVCIEYVVAHELTHLIHPNHSPAFYAELTKIMPDWKRRRDILRSFRPD